MPALFGTNHRTQTAYVVFQESSQRNPTLPKWMTSPGFRHCWLMLPVYYPEPGLMAEVFTEKIESLFWGVETAVWWEHPDNAAKAFLELGVTVIVKYPFTSPPPDLKLKARGPLTCVTLTKAALMIDDWKILTPKALFKYLVRHGGSVYQP